MTIPRTLLLATLAVGCTDSHELGVTTHGFGAASWAVTFGSRTAGGRGTSVVVDAHGDLIAAGVFTGAVDFGSGAIDSNDASAMFVTKRNGATGAELWTVVAETVNAGTALMFPPVLAVDPAGDVFVASAMQESASGSNAAVDILGTQFPAGQLSTLLVAELDPTGALAWAHQLAPRNNSGGIQNPYVAAGSDGGVFVAASFGGVYVTPEDLTFTTDRQDVLVEHIDPTGKPQWGRAFQGSGDRGVAGLVVAPNGDVIVGGQLSGSASFAGPPLVAPSNNQWLARLTSAGTLAWQEIVGAPAVPVDAGPIAIAADGSIVAGYATFGTDGRTTFPALAQLDATGHQTWSAQTVPASPGGGSPVGAAVRADGTVLTLGSIDHDAIDLGNGPIDGDDYLAAYDTTGESGELPAAISYGSGGPSCNLAAIAAAPSGSVALTGSVSGPVNFGTGPVTSAGMQDIVIVLLAPPPAS